MPKKISMEEWEQRIRDAGAGRYEFVRWAVDGEFGATKKCTLRCIVDGYVWSTTPDSLTRNGRGCSRCQYARNGKIRRLNKDDLIERINKIEKIKFIGFCGEYKNSYSRVFLKCEIDGTLWNAGVGNTLRGRGCPRCARTGYDPSKTGSLYALRSECGKYVKVGISNKPSQRHRQLGLDTPFKFSLVEQISGDGVKIRNLEKHFHNKYQSAGFTGFDGATEWLVCSDELLSELRSV